MTQIYILAVQKSVQTRDKAPLKVFVFKSTGNIKDGEKEKQTHVHSRALHVVSRYHCNIFSWLLKRMFPRFYGIYVIQRFIAFRLVSSSPLQ